MAKSPKNIHNFLADLTARLMPKAKEELSTLIATKKNHLITEFNNLQSDQLFHWDFPFYHQQLLRQNHDIDYEEGKGCLRYLFQLYYYFYQDIYSHTNSTYLLSCGIFPYIDSCSGNAQHLPTDFWIRYPRVPR